MSDLTHKAIEDLRAELEQQRTRAEAAEHELAEIRLTLGRHPDGAEWAEPSIDEIAKLQDKLAAIRAHLVGLDLATLDKDEPTSTHTVTNWWEMRKLIAAAREALAT